MASDSKSLAEPLAPSENVTQTGIGLSTDSQRNLTSQDPSNLPQEVELGNRGTGVLSGLQSEVRADPSTEDSEDAAGRDSSPEPATDADVARMKQRLVEMGLTRDDGTKEIDGVAHNPREKELLDMVLTLIRSPRISAAQLAQQASLIGSLQGQQQYLVEQMSEERARWQSEREGWDRMAEALIMQRNKPGPGTSPDEELERKCSTLEADNRILRDRLQETLNRALALEDELSKLKPLLLMVPLSTSSLSINPPGSKSSIPIDRGTKHKQGSPGTEDSQTDREATPTPNGSVVVPQLRPAAFPAPQPQPSASSSTGNATTSSSANLADIYRTQYPYPYPYIYPIVQVGSTSSAPKSTNPYMVTIQNARVQGPAAASGVQAGSSIPSSTTTVKAGKGLDSLPNAVKPKRRSTSSQGLSSDARTEHLLLAARKIGRERAAFVAGVMQQAEKEKERLAKEQENSRMLREAERLERERHERPRNTGGGSSYYRFNGNVTQVGSNTNSCEGSSPHRRGSVTASQVPTQAPTPHQRPVRPPTFVYVRAPGTPDVIDNPAISSRSLANGQTQFRHHIITPPVPQDKAAPSTQNSSRAQSIEHTPLQQPATLPNANAVPLTPQQQQPQTQSIQTPLDSLVNAALGMQDGMQQKDTSNVPGRRRKVNEGEHPESPAPKRRKTTNASANSASTNNTKAAGPSRSAKASRVPSALDVLADQAQAAAPMSQKRSQVHKNKSDSRESEQSGSVNGKASSNGYGGRRRSVRGKGKGKDVAQAQTEDVDDVIMGDDQEDGESEVEDKDVSSESISTQTTKKRGKGKKDTAKDIPPAKSRASVTKAARNSPVASPVEGESAKVVTKRKRVPPRDRTIPLTASSSTSSTHPSTASPAKGTRGKRKGKADAGLKADGEEVKKIRATTRGTRTRVAYAGNKSAAMRMISPADGPRIIAPPPLGSEPESDIEESPHHPVPEEEIEPSETSVTQHIHLPGPHVQLQEGSSPPDGKTNGSEGTSPSNAQSQEEGDVDLTSGDTESSLVEPDMSVRHNLGRGSPSLDDPGLDGPPARDPITDERMLFEAVGTGEPSREDNVGDGALTQDNPPADVGMEDVSVIHVDHVVGSALGAASKLGGEIQTSPIREASLGCESIHGGSGMPDISSSLVQVPSPETDAQLPIKMSEEAGNAYGPIEENEHTTVSSQKDGPAPLTAPDHTPPVPYSGNRDPIQDEATTDSRTEMEHPRIGSEELRLLNADSGNAIASAPASVLKSSESPPDVQQHDSDMDAEAEEDDEDRDAEGEDEDRDAEGEDEDLEGSESHWPQISFSSTDISKSLATMDSLGEDADAEGEIEDESDEPPEAVFRPSELIPGPI